MTALKSILMADDDTVGQKAKADELPKLTLYTTDGDAQTVAMHNGTES